MKFMGVAEAKARFSECLEQAQGEPVVILNHGKPAAMLIGVEGIGLDEVTLEEQQLAKLLAERSKSTTRPWKEVKARLRNKRTRK